LAQLPPILQKEVQINSCIFFIPLGSEKKNATNVLFFFEDLYTSLKNESFLIKRHTLCYNAVKQP